MKLLIICVQHNNTRSMGETIEPAVEKQHENRFSNRSEFAGEEFSGIERLCHKIRNIS